MLETLRLLVDYTSWADARVLEAVSKLSPEQWTQDLGSSLKSVRDTAVHLAGAQWLYYSRCKGDSPKATWNPAEFPTPASLREKWESLGAELSAFAASQTEESLRRPLSYRNLKGEPVSLPLGEVLLQVTNHSTYHRGQIATLLRQLGASPVPTDLVIYTLEKAKKA